MKLKGKEIKKGFMKIMGINRCEEPRCFYSWAPLQVRKAPYLHSLGHSLAPNAVRRTPPWCHWETEWKDWHAGTSRSVGLDVLKWWPISKGKTHFTRRCSITLSKGSLLDLSLWPSLLVVLKDGSPATPTGWEILIFCASFLSLHWVPRVQRGEGGVTSPLLCIGMSPWWQCVCTTGTPATSGAALPHSFNNRPIWSQETTLQRWLGLEVIFNFVTKTNASSGSSKWFYWWY